MVVEFQLLTLLIWVGKLFTNKSSWGSDGGVLLTSQMWVGNCLQKRAVGVVVVVALLTSRMLVKKLFTNKGSWGSGGGVFLTS